MPNDNYEKGHSRWMLLSKCAKSCPPVLRSLAHTALIIIAGYLILSVFRPAHFSNVPTWNFSLLTPVIPLDQIKAGDALHLAYSLGRLDLITILLAVLGLFIAAGSYFGFWMLKSEMHQIVDKETKKEVRRLIDGQIEEYLTKNPAVLTKAIRGIKDLKIQIRSSSSNESHDIDSDNMISEFADSITKDIDKEEV